MTLESEIAVALHTKAHLREGAYLLSLLHPLSGCQSSASQGDAEDGVAVISARGQHFAVRIDPFQESAEAREAQRERITSDASSDRYSIVMSPAFGQQQAAEVTQA